MAKPKIDRKTILKNSLSVFKTKGYSATSMSDLAQASGLLKGSMYHYIESKEQLMLEVLDSLMDYYINKVFITAYDEEFSPYDRLFLLSKKAEEIYIYEDAGNFFANIGLETKNLNLGFNEVIAGFFKKWIDTIEYIYLYVLSREDARAKAESVVAQIEGAVMLMKVMDNAIHLRRVLAGILVEYKELEKENSVK
ncbi:MAG: TetR/AcrR family transcriptional repressor of nem operon [Bacteroidia bacterium]|jgi:TetR/AcrR family transcriptional repressor of nem operon|tara:strand:- start:334 stop:918 length:585 start_codon:yes stop_codon:yes gene_type:complete